jgi:hypothetical protein
MASDLTPSEKEEREVERLINKKPAPSRKRSRRRGPKHDNRRRRIKEDDPDLKMNDKDMSLNYKYSRMLSIASHISGSFQSSNEFTGNKDMSVRTSTYHGIKSQGHPDGPYPLYQTYDRRYFGKEQYDSIVASARSFLQEDWLQNDWGAGSPDAPFRAALDLAIHTADRSLYQSKIDVETYNMLLARIINDKSDLFSETFLPNQETSKRSASSMSNAYQNLLRIASELRGTDPKSAIEIVRNIRSLVASEESSSPL